MLFPLTIKKIVISILSTLLVLSIAPGGNYYHCCYCSSFVIGGGYSNSRSSTRLSSSRKQLLQVSTTQPPAQTRPLLLATATTTTQRLTTTAVSASSSLSSGEETSSPATGTTMKGSINMAMSVDGYIATKDGGIDWLNNQPTVENEDFGFTEFMNNIDVIIMGKNSFDKVVSFGKDMYAYGDTKLVVWTRQNPDTITIPDYLKEKNTIQVSNLPPKQLMEKLQTVDNCTHAYIDGGMTIRQFLQANLIQRMHITRVPILLGTGISLFSSNDDDDVSYGQLNLKHISTKSYDNGFVTTVYDVLY